MLWIWIQADGLHRKVAPEAYQTMITVLIASSARSVYSWTADINRTQVQSYALGIQLHPQLTVHQKYEAIRKFQG